MARSQIREFADPQLRREILEKSRRKLERTSHKLRDLEDQLNRTQKRWLEKAQELEEHKGRGTKKEETLCRQVARLGEKMNKLEEEIEQVYRRKEEVEKEYKRIEWLVKKMEEIEREDARDKLDGEMEDLVRKLVEISQTMTALRRRREIPTLLLREFVKRHFTGFTHSKKREEIGNKVWISRSGKAMCILVPNPKYWIPVEEAITKFGLEAIVPFLQIDYPRFRDAIKAGEVKDKDGQLVSLERLEIVRCRKDQPYKVIPSLIEEEVGEIVFSILDPELANQKVENLEELRNLDKATITALQKNGVTTVDQLGKMDLYTLSKLEGIGEKRASQIHFAIRKIVRRQKR